MHPTLHCWREEIPAALLRITAYVGGLAFLSIAAAYFFQSVPVIPGITPADRSPWIEVERPIAAFALTIPEAAGAPFHYAIRRHEQGGGRKDVLELGEPDGVAPYLQIEVYRPGREAEGFADAKSEIVTGAAALAPNAVALDAPLTSKFGPLSIVRFDSGNGTPRHCLGFVRAYDDPRAQLSGWFCQGTKFGGDDFIERSTLSCALDRLTLLSAGNEPKIAALFAQVELNRTYCGQRDTILAPTPKYKALWQALPNRPDPRRIGR